MLTDDSKKAIGTLKGLVEICNDGQEGYKTAAENVDNSDYKSTFLNYGQQRGMFSSELEAEINRLGGNEDSNNLEGVWNDMVGAVHRGWMDIKSAVTKGNLESILNECERGEDSAVDAYEDALDETDLPLEVSNLIRSQYASIKEAHDRIKSLRDLAKVGSYNS